MNDDENFENDLRRLRPQRPSPELVARIGHVLEQRRAPSLRALLSAVPWKWKAGLATTAALAATVAGMIVIQRPPDGLLPVGTTNVEYATEDEGIVLLANGSPARRVRIHSTDTITWKNPRTEASLEWSQSSEEIRDVPLTFN